MYYVIKGLFWLMSLLPLRVLYFIGDCFYGLVFYILKYRKDIVMNNLKHAFPEKTEKERYKIAKKFYHNLLDTFIEAIKMFSTSEKRLARRFNFYNLDLINSIYPTGRNIQIHLGHTFNWEWGNSVFATLTPYKFIGVYMPISNKIFNKMFYKLRSRSGTIMISAKRMKEEFAPLRDLRYILGLAADQNPGHPGNAWWFNFLGRPAPFLKGPAKGAIANDTVVIFAAIHKPRRGYYDVEFTLAEDDLQGTTEQALTEKFVRYLEDIIRKYPEMWLWSHRRWKWDWKEEYGAIIS